MAASIVTSVAIPLAGASRAVNQNVLPSPGRLLKPSSPAISETSRLLIASPRPVPPKRRVVEVSACSKASNSRDWASSSIPTPVSTTSQRSSTSPAFAVTCVASRRTDPCSVNLTALPAKLSSTWPSRRASPHSISGSAGSIVTVMPSPFSPQRSASMATTLSKTSRSRKSRCSSTTLSASILEISRMSLMIASR